MIKIRFFFVFKFEVIVCLVLVYIFQEKSEDSQSTNNEWMIERLLQLTGGSIEMILLIKNLFVL